MVKIFNTSRGIITSQEVSELFGEVLKTDILSSRTNYICIGVKNDSISDYIKLFIRLYSIGNKNEIKIGLDKNNITAGSYLDVKFYPISKFMEFPLGFMRSGDYRFLWFSRKVLIDSEPQVDFCFDILPDIQISNPFSNSQDKGQSLYSTYTIPNINVLQQSSIPGQCKVGEFILGI